MSGSRQSFAGGCHCGAVRFDVELDIPLVAHACNCSMCDKLGFLHLIAPKSRFHLRQGEDALTEYTFNTGVAKHLFCRTCGVKSFYVPRSNPDGISVNLRCLDAYGDVEVKIEPFDGQNWEANAGALAHLSEDESHAD